jgi:hypothetical protein
MPKRGNDGNNQPRDWLIVLAGVLVIFLMAFAYMAWRGPG